MANDRIVIGMRLSAAVDATWYYKGTSTYLQHQPSGGWPQGQWIALPAFDPFNLQDGYLHVKPKPGEQVPSAVWVGTFGVADNNANRFTTPDNLKKVELYFPELPVIQAIWRVRFDPTPFGAGFQTTIVNIDEAISLNTGLVVDYDGVTFESEGYYCY